jgi:hypothetical protein
MIENLNRAMVVVLVACIIAAGLPRRAPATAALRGGASSPDSAASLDLDTAGNPPAPSSRHRVPGAPVLALGALNAYADPDTSEFQFPEDDSETLVRDITVWVIASAFVAYFIIKVFLEEEDDEPEDEGPPGKRI